MHWVILTNTIQSCIVETTWIHKQKNERDSYSKLNISDVECYGKVHGLVIYPKIKAMRFMHSQWEDATPASDFFFSSLLCNLFCTQPISWTRRHKWMLIDTKITLMPTWNCAKEFLLWNICKRVQGFLIFTPISAPTKKCSVNLESLPPLSKNVGMDEIKKGRR